MNARSKADLEKYRGKLKDAVILTREPNKVNPITDLTYFNRPEPKKEARKASDAKAEAKKTDGKKEDGKKPEEKKVGGRRSVRRFRHVVPA